MCIKSSHTSREESGDRGQHSVPAAIASGLAPTSHLPAHGIHGPSASSRNLTPLSPLPHHRAARHRDVVKETSGVDARRRRLQAAFTIDPRGLRRRRAVTRGKVTFCYYASWASGRPAGGSLSAADVDPAPCSHLVYAFAGVGADGLIQPPDDHGAGSYRKFTALARKHPNVTTLLAIGGRDHGTAAFSEMASTEEGRRRFADSVVVFLRRHGFQGLDVDWEYPTQRGGVPEDKANYVLLLRELRRRLHAEQLLLTTAVGAATSLVGTAYDVRAVAQSVDYISVMTFDYHTPSTHNVTGIHSPLSPLPSDVGDRSALNIRASIAAWVDGGAPRSKLLAGFPLHGRAFTLASAAARGLGAPAAGAGIAGPYTARPGYLGYYEICRKLKTEANWTKVYNNSTASLYVYKDDQWISFDDETTFTIKANYVLEEDLAGVMIWSIDTDDFIGTCSNRKNPLQKVIKETIGS
ncbi:chitinase-like protein 3 [Bacillus rossius redtenbacheri]|uniref:chitinase-like protein 3 n=1 Tax=Bacillus rossius redtenbacheri TaxID=93214 RepID=UPI002FDC9C94